MTIFGWDASDFDLSRGGMNYRAAYDAGIRFFTYKGTEGTQFKHKTGPAIAGAKAAGIPFYGSYVVPRTPGNNGHGTVDQQANYFLYHLDGNCPGWRTDPRFFLQVDLEHWGYDNVSPETGIAMCKALKAKTGKFVILYAPKWAYGNSIPLGFPLWSSDYGNNPAVDFKSAYPGDSGSGWQTYSGQTPKIWQYGSRTIIGTQPGCDANAFRGSVDDFAKMLGGNMAGEIADSAFHDVYDDHGPLVSPFSWMARAVEHPLRDANTKLDKLVAAGTNTVQVGQDELNTAVLEALKNPDVQSGIAAALAAHIKVS